MHELDTAEGVTYRGMVGHAALASALSSCGFYLYPTAYPETSCIALMQAQACGAVPITSRFEGSALPETAGRFDLGPESLLLDDMTRGGKVPLRYLKGWAERVCVAAGGRGEGEQHKVLLEAAGGAAGTGGLGEHRRAMKAWARGQFGWAGVAKQWTQVFDALLGK